VLGTSSNGAAATARREQLTLDFTNISASPCELRGYPDVDFLRAGADGPLSEPDTFSVAQAVTRVELAPGGTAIATATFVTNDPRNVGGYGCDDAVAVRTFLPDSPMAISSGILDANGVSVRHFFVCGHGVVDSALRT
jgi:hypothetical protein